MVTTFSSELDHSKETPSFSNFPWPGGVAEQCNRHRGKGAHCLSKVSLRTAEIGEPRGGPEGPHHDHYDLGSFCRNKRATSAGAKPGNITHRVDMIHSSLVEMDI